MNLYIATVKSTCPLSPFRLVLRDDMKQMKDYLLSIPPGETVKELSSYNLKTKKIRFYTLKDLVRFLED